MCTLTNKLSKKKTGYKVFTYENGKYYSTFTGQEIKVGKVPLPPKYAKRKSNYWNPSIDGWIFSALLCYNKNFCGKTSAFINKVDAIKLYNDMNNCPHSQYSQLFKILIVKIVFNNEIFEGTYESKPIIASDTIKSIKIIKQ